MNDNFLSEPTTEEDAKVVSGEREDAPDGQYKLVIRALTIKGLTGNKPRLEILFGHTGINTRKYWPTRMAVFGKDKLADVAFACGFTKEEIASGLRFGAGQETDKKGNPVAFIQDGDENIVTDRFLGKEVTGVIKTRVTDSGEFSGVGYVKALEG